MKVLLVEDEPGIREAMSELIAEQADVVAPESVREALDAIDRDRFELVLTDLSMEGDRHAGFRILERARRRLLATALVTGSVREERLESFRELKLQALLPKPFALETAIDLLDRFVGLGRRLDEGARCGPEGVETGTRWLSLSAGERVPLPEREKGLGFQVAEGRLRSAHVACGEGARGFLAQGEAVELIAEVPTRLVTVSVVEA